MSKSDQVEILLPLVREYGHLERRRTQSGVTPSEYQRWTDLKTQLEAKFPQGDRPAGGERRKDLRLPTRMLVEFRDLGGLRSALIRNISRGGLFIDAPFTPEIGTQLQLVIKLSNGGESMELPVEVVSANLPGKSASVGMGCKFGSLTAEQQKIVDEMFETALDTDCGEATR
jgi:Tfp pilus assembly protein PilZ